MSIDRFLDQVKVRFNAETSKAIVSAFRHEPLVWRALENDSLQNDFIEFAKNDLPKWQPGILAAFTISPELATYDLKNRETALPDVILSNAAKTLDTIRLTGLKPSSLADAGLLAFNLCGLRVERQSWKGLAAYLATPRNNLSIWRSAFACLPVLVDDFADAVKELIQASPETSIPATTDLIVHAVECTPALEEDKFQTLVDFFADSSLDFQLQSIQLVKKDEDPQFVEQLASSYLAQNPENLSNTETVTNPINNTVEVTSYNQVEELQKFAHLSHLANQPHQAREAIQQAFEKLNANQALLMRNLAIELETSDPEEAQKTWEEVLHLAPDNPVFKQEYAEFLLSSDEEDYGYELIDQLPKNAETTLFPLRYPNLREKFDLNNEKLNTLIKHGTSTNPESITSRFSKDSDNYKAAQFAFEHKNFRLAEEFIDRAMQETPNDLKTIKLSGLIHQHLANVDKAIESSSLVAMFEPANIKNKKDLANLFLQTQQPQKAFEIYQELVSSNSEPTREDLLTYSEIAIKAGKPDIAIPISENFLSRDNLDGEALVTLCNAYIAKGDEESAITLLEHTSAVAPERPASWLSLAKTWTRLGQTDKAMESLQKAKAALPEHPEILSALGTLYLENEKSTEAISVLKQAFQLDPGSTQVRKSLAKAYLNHGYLNEAWSVISPLESDYTSDPDLALTLGKIMIALGDIHTPKTMLRFAWQSSRSDEALRAYTSLLLEQQEVNGKLSNPERKELDTLLTALQERTSLETAPFDMKVLEADIKFAQDKPEAAYKDYLILLDQPEAKSPHSYHHLQHQIGRTALKLNLNDISLASLQEAVLVNPDDLKTRHTLAEAFLASGLQEEGMNAARSALQLSPTDLENVLWYSEFTLHNHNERESIQVLKDAMHLQPEERALYLTLARTYAALGDTEETKVTLNKMLATENITTEEYVNVANLYLHMNDPEEASKIIKKAISNNPSPDFEETRDLAYSVLRLGDAAAALQLLQELEETLGSHLCYPILKSDILAANKQYVPALHALEGMLHQIEFSTDTLPFEMSCQIDPTLDVADYTKAGVYYRAAQLERMIGNLAAAQKHANLALNSSPEKFEYLLLQSELSFAVQNTAKLDSVLDFVNTAQAYQVKIKEITHLLALNALLEHDINKSNLLSEHFLSKESPSPALMAIKAENALHEKNFQQLQSHLNAGEKLLDEMSLGAHLESFNIPKHFSWVWDSVALGIAAWDGENWSLANKCFLGALSDAKVNPVVNKLIAEYLVEKTRVAKNYLTLKVIEHAPQQFDPVSSDEAVHEEQISIAGRYIPAAQMLPILKTGQAVFSGHWNDADEINQYVKTGKQAAQVLSVQVNPDTIKEIQAAFPDAFDVNFQEAIQYIYKKPTACAAIVEDLLKEEPENPLLYCMLAISRQDKPKKAVDPMEKALNLWPDESDWHAIAGSFYEQAGQYQKAANHLEEAIRIMPKNAEYWQMLGDIKVLEKDYHAAKDYFGKAIDLFPDDPEALTSLATINQRLGEHQIAIQCLTKAAELDPQNPLYGESIAESLLAKQDFQAALDQANLVLQDHSTSSRALQTKVKALIGKRQFEEAKRVVQAAKAVVDDPIPFEILKIELDTINNKTSGLNSSMVLAEANPDNVAVLNNLAKYYLEANMQSQAEENLQKSLAIDPSNAETLLSLGRIDRQKGNLDQALSHLSQALSIDPSLIEAYLEMGQTYQNRREVTKALETYHKAINMVEKDPRAYIYASAAYKESKDYRNAEYMLRQAAQISPNDPVIRRQMAAVVALNLVNNLQEAPKRK
ncbi:MAG: tetratricopeptide repeat protein [Anaerolineaceae bacterium]